MEVIELGPLRFELENRRVGDDGGPTMRIRATINGKDTELLRFDAFETDPHYHYAPGTVREKIYHVDPLVVSVIGDGIDFMLELVYELSKMLATAGYEDLVSADEVETFQNVTIEHLEKRWREQTVEAAA